MLKHLHQSLFASCILLSLTNVFFFTNGTSHISLKSIFGGLILSENATGKLPTCFFLSDCNI